MKTNKIFFVLPYIRLLYNQALRKLKNSRRLIIIGSAHRVGSTWVYNLLKDLCALQKLSLSKGVLQANPTKLAVDIDIVEIIQNIQIPSGWYIYKTHSYPPPAEFANSFDKCINFVTVIRDPRDIIVSASFYLANLPKERGGWGEEFSNLSDPERILLVIKRGNFIISHLQEWFNFSFAYKVKYENLLHDSIAEINKILHFLNIKYNTTTINYFYEKHSFKQNAGRDRGIEDKKSFLRKGISGDWKNYFTDECINTFKTSQNGEWNRLLVLLGYEKHLNW
ncbi:MAG: sulfotransferase domain-containing protein [Deltaproteobacteria bacterium]|nr:sulfotransferase domain-containing protein [Deltaproteobacteria bacterium]